MHSRPTPPTAPVAFISEPMDRASGHFRDGMTICRELADTGITTYRPSTTWYGGQYNPQYVEHLNRQALSRADVVVADLRSGVSTIGVPMEIEYAIAHDIPVVVVWPDDRPRSVSLQAAGVLWADNNAEAVAVASDLAHIHHKRPRTGDDLYLKVVLSTVDNEGVMDDPEPERAYSDDAGFDLITSVPTVIAPGAFADVPTTVAGIEPPRGTWGLIIGRSSTMRKRGLRVSLGVIDFGWRGPLFVGVENATDRPVVVGKGDRIAQYILIPTVPAQLVSGFTPAMLAGHPRGHNGFGSSGGHGQTDATPPGGNSLGAFTG